MSVDVNKLKTELESLNAENSSYRKERTITHLHYAIDLSKYEIDEKLRRINIYCDSDTEYNRNAVRYDEETFIVVDKEGSWRITYHGSHASGLACAGYCTLLREFKESIAEFTIKGSYETGCTQHDRHQVFLTLKKRSATVFEIEVAFSRCEPYNTVQRKLNLTVDQRVDAFCIAREFLKFAEKHALLNLPQFNEDNLSFFKGTGIKKIDEFSIE